VLGLEVGHEQRLELRAVLPIAAFGNRGHPMELHGSVLEFPVGRAVGASTRAANGEQCHGNRAAGSHRTPRSRLD
jgi:hypothetical protein